MLLVSDNLQITRADIWKAVGEMDPSPIQRLVERLIKCGAEAIDINSGPLNREPARKMRFLVNAVQDVTDKTILLDTSNPVALEEGLKVCRNPVIINGFSLEPRKLSEVLPLAAKYDADIIGYLLLENGHVPGTVEERLNVAIDIYTRFSKTGLPREKLIIDPIVAPVIWQNGLQQNKAVLSVLRTLPDVLGFEVRTIAGLSNLTTGDGSPEKKRKLEMAFLPMLACSGLDMVMLNVFHVETMEIARACDVLLRAGIFAWEEIG